MVTIPLIKESFKANVLPTQAIEIPISVSNWAKDYPYAPEVKAYLWHDGKNFYIRYVVNEEYIKAENDKDNGTVWKDSCVECFIALDDQGYYNIEANCIGKILVHHRKDKKTNVVDAQEHILSNIKRYPSLGTSPIAGREMKESWSLTLQIPVESFFMHNLKEYNGLIADCNFYKCGDNLPRPHFMSWKKINTDKPDFHRPEFFSKVKFAE